MRYKTGRDLLGELHTRWGREDAISEEGKWRCGKGGGGVDWGRGRT